MAGVARLLGRLVGVVMGTGGPLLLGSVVSALLVGVGVLV